MKTPYDLWLGEVSESPSTYSHYLSDIRLFERWLRKNFGLDAEELPTQWRKAKYKGEVDKEKFLDELNDVLKAFFVHLKKHYTPYTVNRDMSVVMSFLHSFDIPAKPLRIKHPYIVYHNRDMTKEEICLILDHSDVRNRAIYLILYETGIRPATLVNLKWKHIKEEFLAHRIPMKIDLTSDILKCRVSERWTFIGEEGFTALKRYLITERLPLKDEDYLFISEKPYGYRLKANAPSQAFNKLVKKLGFAPPRGTKPKEVRLYCLKKAFKKFMVVEEDYKKFWMGRSDTETHYVSKDPEYHRQLYATGYETLRLHKAKVDSDAIANLIKEKTALEAKVKELESKWQTITPEDVEKVKKLLDLVKQRRIMVTP